VLKTRILTALIILPVTLAVVFLTPVWLFQAAIGLLLLTGCWEFRRLADLPPPGTAALMTLQLLIFALLYYFWAHLETNAITVLALACLAWLVMFTRLFRYRPDEDIEGYYRLTGFFSAVAALSSCWFALCWLRVQPQGQLIVFLLLLLIWASDIGAYFSGKLLGKHKLAPAISPKKTWEGVYGGIVLALAAAFLFSMYIAGLPIPAATLVAMSVLTTLTSVGGDLFISIHKRKLGLDDTGQIFPGHGGVLDRYDSLLAGAPFFALAFGYLGR
jgi:phosphatidate cytidylyltransferase